MLVRWIRYEVEINRYRIDGNRKYLKVVAVGAGGGEAEETGGAVAARRPRAVRGTDGNQPFVHLIFFDDGDDQWRQLTRLQPIGALSRLALPMTINENRSVS